MHAVLLTRKYPTSPNSWLEVSLLQDTETLAKVWEIRALLHTAKRGTLVGSITRRKTRSEAMQIVRRLLYRP